MNKLVNALCVIFYIAALLLISLCQSSFVLAVNDKIKMEIVIGIYDDYIADFKSVVDI
jgi:hypothetical protein